MIPPEDVWYWSSFWWGALAGEAPEWSRNAREAIGVNGEVTCSGQKAAEPRSMVCHLLNGVDVVGCLSRPATSQSNGRDRPRLGGLFGLATTTGDRRASPCRRQG